MQIRRFQTRGEMVNPGINEIKLLSYVFNTACRRVPVNIIMAIQPTRLLVALPLPPSLSPLQSTPGRATVQLTQLALHYERLLIRLYSF